MQRRNRILDGAGLAYGFRSEKEKTMETKRRLVAKSLTLQMSGFVVMALISYAVSGSFTASLSIALGGMFSGFVAFFVHELIWAKIRWGRIVG